MKQFPEGKYENILV